MSAEDQTKRIDPKDPGATTDTASAADKAAERKTSAIRAGKRKLGRFKFK
jgi:hypothetical protein